jgi:hypothetical protein
LRFKAEALLRDQLCDREGRMRDIVLLAHQMEENWEDMKALGIDAEV